MRVSRAMQQIVESCLFTKRSSRVESVNSRHANERVYTAPAPACTASALAELSFSLVELSVLCHLDPARPPANRAPAHARISRGSMLPDIENLLKLQDTDKEI